MIKRLIGGGAATVIIGGTAFTVSQSSVTNNFAKNTGMSQQQAQQYVNNSQNDLVSFSKVGQQFSSDGSSVLKVYASIDCTNYTYQWVSNSLSCTDGANELQTIGNDEITLGNCYSSLDTNLKNNANSQINNCINDIDEVDGDYNLPIATALLSTKQITDFKNSNIYNKSVLQAALQSN